MTVKFYSLLNIFFGPRHSSLRIGQHCFNELHKLFPEVAMQIQGTDVDPFYKNEVLPEFLLKVRELL